MGNSVRRTAMQKQNPALPPHLDRETGLLVDEMVELLVNHHPDILAIILYGSIARHEERALDDPYPMYPSLSCFGARKTVSGPFTLSG
jgi:hypothetical protein